MTAARQYIADEVVHTDTDSVHTVVPSRDEAATARLSWEVAVASSSGPDCTSCAVRTAPPKPPRC